MSLSYPPKLGAVVVCDFRGFAPPEMVKRREVVVVGRHRNNKGLVTIIPLSATAPEREESHHHRLSRNPRPGDDPCRAVWAKCDLIYTLSTERMDLHHVRSRRGGRQFVSVKLSQADFDHVRRCVAAALGLTYTPSIPSSESESGSGIAHGVNVEPAEIATR